MIIRFCSFGLFLLLVSCVSYPPKTIRLPAELAEASGLSINGNRFVWHNDSGDGPYLYTTDKTGEILARDTLSAPAFDNEDLTVDAAGNYYIGDFGNNAGQQKEHQIYRYNPTTTKTSTIRFTYPGQDGGGRDQPGNYNCEAMIFQGGYLHLFTKDQLFGRGKFYTYHYRLPAQPGSYVAELVDSLYLPRRVVTAAALDTVNRQLVLTAYNFKMLGGFWPSGAASLITISEYPDGHFLRGQLHRQNLAWFWPTQFEAVDFYDERWLYVASEATKLRKHGVGKRKRRRRRGLTPTTDSPAGKPSAAGRGKV